MDLETTDYGKRGETKGAKGARRSGRDGGGCGGRRAGGERGGKNDASTTCETALKEREAWQQRADEEVGERSEEREEAMQRPVCLLPLLPAILGKWGPKTSKEIVRTPPAPTSLQTPSFIQFLSTFVFYLEGIDR
jgi:hypothetical protein